MIGHLSHYSHFTKRSGRPDPGSSLTIIQRRTTHNNNKTRHTQHDQPHTWPTRRCYSYPSSRSIFSKTAPIRDTSAKTHTTSSAYPHPIHLASAPATTARTRVPTRNSTFLTNNAKSSPNPTACLATASATSRCATTPASTTDATRRRRLCPTMGPSRRRRRRLCLAIGPSRRRRRLCPTIGSRRRRRRPT